jgi:uncharacterized membrane protein (DUF373 family)
MRRLSIERFVEQFERVVIMCLLVLLMGVIALAVIDLGWIIIEDIITPPVVLLAIDELLEIFGFFLLILIGLELLETVKVYLHTSTIRVEIVVEVALIAIARKIIILKSEDGFLFIGIAAIVLALAGAIYLARRDRRA